MAKQMVYTARNIKADEAYRIGLVNNVYPIEELMPAAKLRIETIPAVTHCGECGQDYSTVPQGRSCPYCGSEETWLIRGDEINIKEIEAI